MAIDRIGKGGGAPPAAPDASGVDKAGEAGKAGKTGAVGKTFEVRRADAVKQADAAQAAQATHAAGSPLARLRAGEIDVHGYLDLKVDEATAGLHGVPRAQLDEIKKTLRDQLASDPGLADLVRTATGQTPKPPED